MSQSLGRRTLCEATIRYLRGHAIPAADSWGEQLDAVAPLTDPDDLDVNLMVERDVGVARDQETSSLASPLRGGSALDWADMEGKGFSHLPPVGPLPASHLRPTQMSTMTSAGPALPSEAECFRVSSPTEKRGEGVEGTASLFAGLPGRITGGHVNFTHPSAVGREVRMVMDLSAASSQVRCQEPWPRFSLRRKEKKSLLAVPVNPKGLSGPAVATMQRKRRVKRCNCVSPGKCHPPTAPRQTLAQAVAQPGLTSSQWNGEDLCRWTVTAYV
ncbi:unnamed protein product [Merluccius merluccius]